MNVVEHISYSLSKILLLSYLPERTVFLPAHNRLGPPRFRICESGYAEAPFGTSRARSSNTNEHAPSAAMHA
jgi:hypothetical protein